MNMDTNRLEELKQCPFCGGIEIMVFSLVITGLWLGECAGCGSQTALFNTEAEAITAWNRRAELARRAATPDEAKAAIEYFNGQVEMLESLKESLGKIPAPQSYQAAKTAILALEQMQPKPTSDTQDWRNAGLRIIEQPKPTSDSPTIEEVQRVTDWILKLREYFNAGETTDDELIRRIHAALSQTPQTDGCEWCKGDGRTLEVTAVCYYPNQTGFTRHGLKKSHYCPNCGKRLQKEGE
jgi:Lar family restriction alleviation protein